VSARSALDSLSSRDRTALGTAIELRSETRAQAIKSKAEKTRVVEEEEDALKNG
jgi:hypothetical protein